MGSPPLRFGSADALVEATRRTLHSRLRL